MRGGRHHGHAAEADDFELKDGRALRQQDFRYVAEEDVYICPAGERLIYHYTNEENGMALRRYWTNARQSCAIKHSCTCRRHEELTP